MPDAPMLTGAPQVRGFRLDGYGVFFDVEVPALRLPLTWPLRYMVGRQPRSAVNAAHGASCAAMSARAAARRSATRPRGCWLAAAGAARPRCRSVGAAPQVRPGRCVSTIPNEAYTREVKEALIDAMIENSGPLASGPTSG